MNLLETTHLTKSYNGRRVVDEVSFVLHQQEVVGLLGRNGAGKTTTFRMILGMVVPDSGAVTFDGQDITHLPMYKRARRGIGYLAQDRSDFRRLTVWQNLMAILETLRLSYSERKRRAEQLLSQYGLVKQKNQSASTLSGGERRKMEIARALVTDPKLILLDEPFAGVDPIAKEELSREVRRLKEEFRKTVLITDHDVAFTLRVVDRALIIDAGQVQFSGTPRETINDPGVRSAYLGNTFRGDEFDQPIDTHLPRQTPARQTPVVVQSPVSQAATPTSVATAPASPSPRQAPARQPGQPTGVPAASPGPAMSPGIGTSTSQPQRSAARPSATPARPAASAPTTSMPTQRPAASTGYDPTGLGNNPGNSPADAAFDDSLADIFAINRPGSASGAQSGGAGRPTTPRPATSTGVPAQAGNPPTASPQSRPVIRPANQSPIGMPPAGISPTSPSPAARPTPRAPAQPGTSPFAGPPINGTPPTSPFANPPARPPAAKPPAPRPPEQF
jgi:lipopolysaccharide export system ATP-binding protein